MGCQGLLCCSPPLSTVIKVVQSLLGFSFRLSQYCPLGLGSTGPAWVSSTSRLGLSAGLSLACSTTNVNGLFVWAPLSTCLPGSPVCCLPVCSRLPPFTPLFASCSCSGLLCRLFQWLRLPGFVRLPVSVVVLHQGLLCFTCLPPVSTVCYSACLFACLPPHLFNCSHLSAKPVYCHSCCLRLLLFGLLLCHAAIGSNCLSVTCHVCLPVLAGLSGLGQSVCLGWAVTPPVYLRLLLLRLLRLLGCLPVCLLCCLCLGSLGCWACLASTVCLPTAWAGLGCWAVCPHQGCPSGLLRLPVCLLGCPGSTWAAGLLRLLSLSAWVACLGCCLRLQLLNCLHTCLSGWAGFNGLSVCPSVHLGCSGCLAR